MISIQIIFCILTAIVCLFCAIGLFNQTNISTTIFVTLVSNLVINCLHIIIYLFGEIFENSQEYSKSYLKNDLQISKWEKSYYKSCKPFGFRINKLVMINTATNLYIMSDIVLARVCDLLIAFK